ncbi:MAG: rod shape-determining protein RodA [Kiritimatiellae bacterium]|nr:rod shape-determining protein RodA [Kiritimatiellia bacterium]
MDVLRRVNWVQVAAMLLLVAIGTTCIWSAGNAREAAFHGMWKANLRTAALGLAIYAALAWADYRKVLQWVSLPAYAGALVLLVAVLALGSEIYGGRRWLWFFQPSEISKLCIIAFLAQVFGMKEPPAWLRSVGGFGLGCALFGIPALLVLMEPDLGTALALAPAFLVMLLAGRVWRRGITALLVAGALGAAALLGAVHEAERPGVTPERREAILRHVPLKPHQLKRVKTFLYPDTDPAGAGYTIRQAMIAIGSGGFAGRGIGKGETNSLKYLPPSISMNDFIFCVYAEETGFVGSLVLLSLFATLCVSCAWIAWGAADLRGRLFALGFATLLFAHVYVNVGMSVGLLPITGLPLPFISSGRTFLLTVMAGLGITQSISIHKEEET